MVTKCHICNNEIVDDTQFALISTRGIYSLCEYCKAEQVVIAEVDEEAQTEGLEWANQILEKL
jgi:hypothetical protein